LKRDIFWRIFQKYFWYVSHLLKCLLRDVNQWRGWHPGRCSTCSMCGRNKNNLCSDDQKYRKKNRCRVINHSLFLSAMAIFVFEFALSVFTQVSAGVSSHYGDPCDVMATPKYFSVYAERMPNAYPNHKCVDTHCRSAIGHVTAYNRRF